MTALWEILWTGILFWWRALMLLGGLLLVAVAVDWWRGNIEIKKVPLEDLEPGIREELSRHE